MKLLLTSGGITNPAIADALLELNGKPAEQTILSFIPTAMNVEEGDKSWLLKDLRKLQDMGFGSIDMVDISAIPREMWEARLRLADVLLLGGGNTYHLMYWIRKSGLEDLLPELLETRTYVGISAGSVVAGKYISTSSDPRLTYPDIGTYQESNGMGFVDFSIKPHLHSPWFPDRNANAMERLAKDVGSTLYALDDQTALKIVDGTIEEVGGGECLVFNA